jgi:hypothetical protein
MRGRALQIRFRGITVPTGNTAVRRPSAGCVSGASRRAMGYAGCMSFSREELDLIDRSEEVEIETSADDGRTRRTIIWIVVDGGDVFVRSVRGPLGRWYREAAARGEATMHVDGRSIPVIVRPATDEQSVARTSLALERKYSPGGPLRSMLRPEVVETTLRLDRA